MKTINGDKSQVTSLRQAPARQASDQTMAATREAHSCHAPRVTGRVVAFTLIELITVIAIIGVLAAFTLPVLSGIKRQQYRRQAQAELEHIETAIERYKAAEGFYPPSSLNGVLTNQLYYELVGTTTNYNGGNLQYQTLDGGSTIAATGANSVSGTFGVAGFMNCTKGSGEDAVLAKTFLPELRPNQIGDYAGVKLLVTAVGGPDETYKPLGQADLNPWRYNASNPTNNPGSYDLWVQLSIGGKTNLICNWSKQVQLNSPLP
jgi:prepilin-type N-terminal cleavage/methylation domain-containing protein